MSVCCCEARSEMRYVPSGNEDDLARALPNPPALDALLLEQLGAQVRVKEELLRVNRAAKRLVSVDFPRHEQ